MRHFLAVCVTFGLLACANHDGGVLNTVSSCPEITSNYEIRTEGEYTSPAGDIFKVILDFEDKSDEKYSFSAEEFAHMAYAVSLASQELNLENQERTKKYLKTIHVIVTSSDELFASLYFPDKYHEDPEIYLQTSETWSAFVSFGPHRLCWNDFDDIEVTIVMRNQHADNLRLMMHECTHVIGYLSFSDSDINHDDERLWESLGGEMSVQGKAVKIYEEQNNTNY